MMGCTSMIAGIFAYRIRHVSCGDDACALFGSNRDVTVKNCFFSRDGRYSVLARVIRRISSFPCVSYDTFGCPIKVQVEKGSRLDNILFRILLPQKCVKRSPIVDATVENPVWGPVASFANRKNQCRPGRPPGCRVAWSGRFAYSS